MIHSRSKSAGLTLVMAGLAGAMLSAAPPTLPSLFPAGGQIGSSFTVKVGGTVGADVSLWTNAPGVTFTPSGQKAEWKVDIKPDAKPGLYLLHASNPEGASEARWFSLGRYPEILEVEPNDALEAAQVLQQIPVCINGKLEKREDVDAYSLKLNDGQTLVGLVEAYALGSGVDVMAHVVNEAGERVLTVSDGRNLDPFIVYQAPKAGRYTVQIAGFTHPPAADVRFIGNANLVYRLHLSSGPVVTHVHPNAVSTTAKTEVELKGYNLDPARSKVTVDASQLREMEGFTVLDLPNAMAPIQVVPCEGTTTVEKEPNHTKEQATPIQPGCVGGTITGKEDVDRYALTLKKGERMEARVWSKQLGLPLDAVLKIEGPDGKLLTTVDDQGGSTDPQAQWTAAVDGVYQVIVEGLYHRGPPADYVLQAGAPAPGFTVDLMETKPVLLEPGKTVSLKLKIAFRNGYKEALVARVEQAPAGVFAAEVPIPEKGGEVEIKLQAAANAPPASLPIHVSLWTKTEPPRTQKVSGLLRGELLRGTSLADRSSVIWLTVKGPVAAKK